MNAEGKSIASWIVDEFIEQHPLPVGSPHACPYLSDRVACSEGFRVESLEPGIHAALMDRGFRRSGQVIYRPKCASCSACTPLRVPVREFRLSRSMRRVWRRNGDVRVEVGLPEPTEEKYELYTRYLQHQHDGTMGGSREEFVDFLYDSPTDTLEFAYMLGRRIVGVSLADVGPGLLSSVYMYFDPAFRQRSLGTYSVLWEISHSRDRAMDFYYLGYYIAGCRTMNYKARFRPHELLNAEGVWVRSGDAAEDHVEPA